ncbi:MAG: LUD domain-containing protein [Phycisphaerae bacterium]|nr:LUD domain-containing protein [Phycisphaerae bacterium]
MSDSYGNRPPPIELPRMRTQFLSRVRQALGHAETIVPAARPARKDAVVREVSANDPGRIERWIKYASGNGMSVQRVRPDGVVAAIEKALLERSARRVMLNGATWPVEPLAQALSVLGMQVHRWTEPGCARDVFECDAAVTDCRYGLADTGALMVWSDAGFGRSSTLTVNLHIVILSADKILGDLVDAMVMLGRDTAGNPPSNVVIINGPSKTSDIEMNLVTGVHGPKFLSVIVVDPHPLNSP